MMWLEVKEGEELYMLKSNEHIRLRDYKLDLSISKVDTLN